MTYPEALQYLRDLEPRGWRLGLERMTEFVRLAGLSDTLGSAAGPQYIHVAGTNGKGSVTAFAQSMLLACGYRTGAFFSPYVVDPRERAWFGREMISESDFCRSIERLKDVSEELEETEFSGVTEFEMKTAVGFDHWRSKRAEWVALEVGLGGRFDATNVVVPRASVIVSIGLDHVNILGDTLGKIAFEKAGIVKPGVPVVIGEMAPEARDVILNVATHNESPVWSAGQEISWSKVDSEAWEIRTPRSHVTVRPSLYGDVQGHNAALAYAAMELAGAGSGQCVADAAAEAILPGRFQVAHWKGRRWVLDGAHNAEAAQILRASVEAYASRMGADRILLVAGMVSGHDPLRFFGPFEGLVEEVHLAPIDFHRALAPQDLGRAISGRFDRTREHFSLLQALEAAVQDSSPTDLLVVTGSFYLVGEALRLLRTVPS